MLSARIHKYQEPLAIDDTSKPNVHGEEVVGLESYPCHYFS
ncbi:MAG: hypothetical protein WB053_02415 [Nitrososphaeraceae archaeon]